MHGFSQSHVEYTAHRSTFIVGHGGEEEKKISTYMYPLRRYCHLAEFHSRRFAEEALWIQARL